MGQDWRGDKKESKTPEGICESDDRWIGQTGGNISDREGIRSQKNWTQMKEEGEGDIGRSYCLMPAMRHGRIGLAWWLFPRVTCMHDTVSDRIRLYHPV